jgi:hypothetical protein
MNKSYLGAAALVSLAVLATSSSVAMAKGTDDKPVVVKIDQSGSNNNVDAKITNNSSNPIPVTVQERAKVIVVGVTDEVSQGNVGLLILNERCAAKFPGGHWCMSREVLTGYQEEVTDTPGGFAWVQPSIAGAFHDPVDGPQAIDASGVIGLPRNLSCNGWTNTGSSLTGLIVQLSPFGGISDAGCTSERPAICCASRVLD